MASQVSKVLTVTDSTPASTIFWAISSVMNSPRSTNTVFLPSTLAITDFAAKRPIIRSFNSTHILSLEKPLGVF